MFLQNIINSSQLVGSQINAHFGTPVAKAIYGCLHLPTSAYLSYLQVGYGSKKVKIGISGIGKKLVGRPQRSLLHYYRSAHGWIGKSNARWP